MGYVKKRREECVLFLDEGFAAESVAAQLRTAGFTVQRFHEWFRDENGNARSNVPDPEIIRFCSKNGWLLVSRDHEMKRLHREEIRKSEVAVLATANNKAEIKASGLWQSSTSKAAYFESLRSVSALGSAHLAGRAR